MDPNANLKEQREIVARMIELQDMPDDPPTDEGRYAEHAQLAARLAELVQALDEWITKGGALPAAWGKRAAR